MRKIAAIIIALWALSARADAPPSWATGSWATGSWATGSWDTASSPSDVEVPNVIGQVTFAAADTILEAEGLDGNETAAVCSTSASGVIVGQNPPAGTFVAPATIVDVTPSSGVECPRTSSRSGISFPGASTGF